MSNFILTQNSFSSGEVSPEFFSRENINGLSKLENMDVLPSGGIRRRRGLQTVAVTHSGARLIPFSVGENDDYILSLTDGHIRVYHNGQIIDDILSPWGASDLDRLQYAQRFGTMIFVHPDYQPQILKKSADGMFDISKFQFESVDNVDVKIPYIKFDDMDGVRIQVGTSSRGNNYATFTTNKDFWTPDYVEGKLRVIGRQWHILEYTSPRTITVMTGGTWNLPSGSVSDWSEAAFSPHRGWPTSITFHQNRLVFGGARSYPSGVWMSKVGAHNNFDVGTGLDDEAIFITLLSEQRQQICTIISSDNLQILTSVGEWAISNKPLTPSAVNIKQHTSVGSFSKRYLPPQKIESGTAFVSKSGREIREMALDELGENYRANDLCALSRHLITEPIDLAYNDRDGQLFVVQSDGAMAVLNKNPALGVSAWGVYKTDGMFKSVAVLSGETYVSVERGDTTFIEKFSYDTPTDGNHSFSFTACGMPILASKHGPKKIRIRKMTARVLDTKSLSLNGYAVNFPNAAITVDAPGYTGDVSVNMLGGAVNAATPVWIAHGDESHPVTILSITINGFYTI